MQYSANPILNLSLLYPDECSGGYNLRKYLLAIMLVGRSKIIRKSAVTCVCRDNFHVTFMKFIQQTKWALNLFLPFDVRKYRHHHKIQIYQPTRSNSFTSLLLDVYLSLNMFRGLPRPSPGAYNCTRSLWFYRWSLVVGAFLVVVCQTTTNNAPTATLQR